MAHQYGPGFLETMEWILGTDHCFTTAPCTPNRRRPLTGANLAAAIDYTDYAAFDCSGTVSVDFSKGTPVPFEDILAGILDANGEPAYAWC